MGTLLGITSIAFKTPATTMLWLPSMLLGSGVGKQWFARESEPPRFAQALAIALWTLPILVAGLLAFFLSLSPYADEIKSPTRTFWVMAFELGGFFMLVHLIVVPLTVSMVSRSNRPVDKS
ncbi:MAG: hypothetical protein AAF830_14015 [Pseudomonadota bacterium]